MGRRTRDEEINAYLEELGLDRAVLERSVEDGDGDGAGDDSMPETFSEMRGKALEILWADFKDLKGVAKVNAFNAIAALAKQFPDGTTEEEDEPEPLVADVIAGIVKLPDEKKLEVLARERERLLEELAAIDALLPTEVVNA